MLPFLNLYFRMLFKNMMENPFKQICLKKFAVFSNLKNGLDRFKRKKSIISSTEDNKGKLFSTTQTVLYEGRVERLFKLLPFCCLSAWDLFWNASAALFLSLPGADCDDHMNGVEAFPWIPSIPCLPLYDFLLVWNTRFQCCSEMLL